MKRGKDQQQQHQEAAESPIVAAKICRSPRNKAAVNPQPLTRSDTIPIVNDDDNDEASVRPKQQQQVIERIPTDDSVRSSETDPAAEQLAQHQLDADSEQTDDDDDEESQRVQSFLTAGTAAAATISKTNWRQQLEALRLAPNLNPLPYSCPPRPGHTVLFRIDNFYLSQRSHQPPQPWPAEFSDRWESGYVRMPCSPQNVTRWSAIEHSLNQLKSNKSVGIDELATALNQCSGRRQSSNLCLDSLIALLTEELDRREMRLFLNRVLPGMVRLALALPHLVTKPPPLLRCGHHAKLTLSQLQVASLLSNAFFSTFPRRSFASREYANFPTINFSTLFTSGGQPGSGCPRRFEKLKCLFNYFQRVTSKDPLGVVTFSRRVMNERIDWSVRSERLPTLLVASDGTIEDDGAGMLEVDFANAYIGGGVLGRGLVQEEIRFLICPELLLSRLLAESLEDGEALWITGAERYSDYVGYSSTFQWNGNHKDARPRDSNRRLVTKVVAIDARCYSRGAAGYKQQFAKSAIDRELHKALVGFGGPPIAKKLKNMQQQQRRPVATGNWGCGAFGGNLQLKSLLQLMACSVAGRSCVYFTFGDSEFQQQLEDFRMEWDRQGLTVGQLYQSLMTYSKLVRSGSNRIDLFRWLLDQDVKPPGRSASFVGSLVDPDYDSNDTETTKDEASDDDDANVDLAREAATPDAVATPTMELPSSDAILVHREDDLKDLIQAEAEINDPISDPPNSSDISVDPM